MMHVLLESAPPVRPRGRGWTVASFATHMSAIAVAVSLTGRVIEDVVPVLVPDTLIYVIPERPPAPAMPAVPRLPTGGLTPNLPALPTIPTITTPEFLPSVIGTLDFGPTELTNRIGVSSGAPIPNAIHGPEQVERVVRPRADNPTPQYPSALRSANVEGDVLARFVVDTLGRVERGSITMPEATHALFAEAVRQWLSRTRYEPATIGGQPVRQLVEQRVGFTLRR